MFLYLLHLTSQSFCVHFYQLVHTTHHLSVVLFCLYYCLLLSLIKRDTIFSIFFKYFQSRIIISYLLSILIFTVVRLCTLAVVVPVLTSIHHSPLLMLFICCSLNAMAAYLHQTTQVQYTYCSRPLI